MINKFFYLFIFNNTIIQFIMIIKNNKFNIEIKFNFLKKFKSFNLI